jgi:TPR repeat protein
VTAPASPNRLPAMPLKDLLKKKEKISQDDTETAPPPKMPPTPEFTFMRTDTNTQEIIKPPSFAGDHDPIPAPSGHLTTPTKRRSLGRFRKSSNSSITPRSTEREPSAPSRKLSQRLHLSRASSASSVHIPSDLPAIPDPYTQNGNQQEKEAQWEERATRLAKEDGSTSASRRGSDPSLLEDISRMKIASADPPGSRPNTRPRSISDAVGDENIQEAIRLHEAGELSKATEMFGRLAETGNVLSQVLYGLSLRHGWGCQPDPTKAVTYLRTAASNSAAIEAEALRAGMKKGGAAKGELVLAIFELANCFRNGWGVQVDKAAARQYYETAANLGDTDAMNEAAWCYLEGFGGKKDKVSEEGLRSSLAARLSGLSCTGIHLAAKMPGTIVALFVSRRRTDPW